MIKIPSEIRLKEKLIDITGFNDYKLVSEREELQVEYYLDKKKKSDRLIDGYSNFLEQIGVET